MQTETPIDEQTENQETRKTFDALINLTGRRLSIWLDGENFTRYDVEPAPMIARVVSTRLEPEEPILLTNGAGRKVPIPVFSREKTEAENLPRPKSGVIYVVKKEVACHPKVRNRSDVFYPNYPTGGSSVCDGLARGDR